VLSRIMLYTRAALKGKKLGFHLPALSFWLGGVSGSTEGRR